MITVIRDWREWKGIQDDSESKLSKQPEKAATHSLHSISQWQRVRSHAVEKESKAENSLNSKIPFKSSNHLRDYLRLSNCNMTLFSEWIGNEINGDVKRTRTKETKSREWKCSGLYFRLFLSAWLLIRWCYWAVHLNDPNWSRVWPHSNRTMYTTHGYNLWVSLLSNNYNCAISNCYVSLRCRADAFCCYAFVSASSERKEVAPSWGSTRDDYWWSESK